jgi:hypothetical protein
MKNIYLLSVLFSFVMFSGCSKDFLKKYDKRIIGTWRISDVDRIGIGGDSYGLPFRDGTFIFSEGGSLTYITTANVTYQGTWDIDKKPTGDEYTHSFQITVVNFQTQHLLTQYYDDMNFAGTDHFKANINSGLHTYVTHFRR